MVKWVKSPPYRVAIKRLVDARLSVRMTQRQLADAIDKPPSYVAKVERGERRLDIIEFIAIARALGIKEVDLFRSIAGDLPRRFDI